MKVLGKVLTMALLGLLVSFGCRTSRVEPPLPVGPVIFDPFPATTPGLPDSALASQIYADSNLVVVRNHISGTYPRDIVWVAFTPESTTEERQAAVEAIGGRVVGGQAVTPHGFYYVQIVGDSTDTPLWNAITHLESLPQVEFAAVDFSLMISGHP